jgi:[ribosomal protein S18]-alanine N-acetyltransferase
MMTSMMTVFRPGGMTDLAAVKAIQYRSPGAAQWNPEDYLEHEFWVAAMGQAVVGFLVMRRVAADEGEILNFAVAREFRRRHVAAGLFRAALHQFRGAVFLEVRESNEAAQEFYKYLGFQVVSLRQSYYDNPSESAIVMKFHSC